MSSVEPDKHTPWAQPSPIAPPPPPAAPHLRVPPPPPTGPGIGQVSPGSTTPVEHPIDPSAPDPGAASQGKRLALVAAASLLAVVGIGLLGDVFNRSWDPALEPYIAYVEAERGLEFTEPVRLRYGDIAAELEDSAPTETLAAEDDPWAQAYALLGLIAPDPVENTEQSEFEALSENAGAFYDPPTETIVLPEGASELELSVTIVHELTHALQHQHGMLGSGGAFESPDGSVSRRVLIEGDAERIANAWYWEQPETFRAEYLEAVGYDPDRTPEDPGDNFLVASFYASYQVGLPMVQSIVEVEGQAGIDALLRSKDTGTTERLVDVFGDNRLPTVNAIDEMMLPEGSEGVIGDLGPLTLFQALAPTIGTAEAFDALTGYDNDAFAMFEQDGTPCARFSIFFESTAEGNEFIDTLDAADLGGTRELRDTEVLFDVCQPIADPAFQRFGTVLPLVVAQEAALAYVLDGAPLEQARCASLALAGTVPADQPSGDFIGWEALEAQMPQFLTDCE